MEVGGYFGQRQALLVAVAQVFQAGALVRRFVIADDEGVVRAFLVGFAQLVFQRLDLGLYEDGDVGVAQALYQRQQARKVCVIGGDGIDGGRGVAEGVTRLRQQQDALDAEGKSGGWGRFAAQLFNQAIVAAAGGDGALCAEGVGRPFEDSVAVVVEAADEARVAAPGDALCVQ